MATRYYCDGCDGPIDAGHSFIVKFVTPMEEMAYMKQNDCRTVPGDCYDLCPVCETRLRRSINPKQWPRAQREGDGLVPESPREPSRPNPHEAA